MMVLLAPGAGGLEGAGEEADLGAEEGGFEGGDGFFGVVVGGGFHLGMGRVVGVRFNGGDVGRRVEGLLWCGLWTALVGFVES